MLLSTAPFVYAGEQTSSLPYSLSLNTTFHMPKFPSPVAIRSCLESLLLSSKASGSTNPCDSLLNATALYQLTRYEIASIVAPVAAYWLYCVFLHYVAPVLPFLDRYRLPTNQPRRPKNRVSVGEVVRAVIIQHTLQMVLATILAVVTHDPVEANRIEHPAVMTLKVVAGMVVIDTWEYWLHRWMHTNPWLYRNFHSVHHRITENFSFAALYNHPLEGLVLDSLGGAVASLVTFMSPLTSAVFFTVATLKTVDDHSGYRWPWVEAIFANNAQYHDVHHWGKGIKYNFDQPFFIIWDNLCGTRWTFDDKDLPEDASNQAATFGKSSLFSSDARQRTPKTSDDKGKDD
ncbi:hypothetical protein M427DRAFT_52449 [Gonapodya prolifera JEL478]|uniref:Fatty acid hydroxylase domain-containing protein n=1 Tax=Gonapodya prolifera (strain JEL478) TaxID=1344416 RepID=A0A139AU09_GONPJ|nr:hypothetical protein M427DRAFT_52449 [Gonapodya prolifera JEL478]|eukprot:KXS20198.1 hypothetical protein M427DRAFT_52449 [Gonapodya prolifera JEL478]